MSSKEKAKELVARYMILFSNQEQYLEEAKQCAIIAVDEIFKTFNKYTISKQIEYWEEVKLEIEKL